MLAREGQQLYGLSLEVQQRSHFYKANLADLYSKEFVTDVRDKAKVDQIVKEVDPDVIVHMAAQPLVIHGYKNPFETFSVNVTGTLNILEAATVCERKPLVLVVTTDKVYRNTGERRPFKETDCLGGSDPYSASKSMADLLAQSWSKIDTELRVLVARAGNVIGGGDYAEGRLFPDLAKSLVNREKIKIRNPDAVRPWQHVLDCLSGYMKLVEAGLVGLTDQTWNFGPNPSGYRTVLGVAKEFMITAGEIVLEIVPPDIREDFFLTLDSTKAKNNLGWSNKLSFDESVAWTTEWFKEEALGTSMRKISERQLDEYMSR
jgi:CDP-glucose 4,6-dehydratase